MAVKKICFVSLNNLYLSPYLEKYTSIMDCRIDVIYWNRHSIKEDLDAATIHPFNFKTSEDASKLEKLRGYMCFKKFASKIIKKNKYDGVVLLQTSCGILLSSILKTKYKYKYILDIRDYTMENNIIFYIIEKAIIKYSFCSVISSEGFKEFLPIHNYVLVHNDVKIDEKTIERFAKRKNSNKRIVISCIGLIRFYDQNIKVIEKFKNDDRFLLKFIGKGSYSLIEYCKINNIKNVKLIDRFPQEKTIEYYYDTDIINNLYGNMTPLLDYALSNKLYYAAKLYIPILVCPGTYMEYVSTKYSFGYSFDIEDPNACDKLFNYYKSNSWIDLKENCDKFMKTVELDNSLFAQRVKNFVKKV